MCDFAETYHIFDIYSHPVEFIATLAAGLRNDSRSMMKASGLKVDMKTLLIARIADNTALNLYAKTKDARTGRNMPQSLTETLLEYNKNIKKAKEFATGDDFLNEWNRITRHG